MRAHFFDPATGIFHGSITTSDPEILRANTPPGCGVHVCDDSTVDHDQQRIDMATGLIVPWQRPIDPVDPRVAAISEIRAIEAAHVRSLREMVLLLASGAVVDPADLERLRHDDTRIAQRRIILGSKPTE